ncbi:MAG: hypothetical protein WCJ62_00185 [Flavobacterium sp.]
MKIYARKYFTTVNNCAKDNLTDKPGEKIMTVTAFFNSACVAMGVLMLMVAAIAAPFILFR